MPDIPRSLAARLVKQAWADVEIDGSDPLGSGASGVVWPVRVGEEAQAVKIIELGARSRIRSGARVSAASELNREWGRVTSEAARLESGWIVGIEGWHLCEERSNEDEVKAYGLVRMERWPWNLDRYVVRSFEVLGTRQTIDLIRAVARTLHGIWRDKQYIFPDLKPENLLVRELGDGSVRVVIGDIGGLQGLSSLTSQAARTVAWSAPEVAIGGDEPDLLSTIYSFGLVAYFIVEGHLPYEDAESARARLALIRERGGPDFRDGLPRELDRVVATIKSCLSHDRGKRPQTFDEVLDGLRSTKQTGVSEFFVGSLNCGEVKGPHTKIPTLPTATVKLTEAPAAPVSTSSKVNVPEPADSTPARIAHYRDAREPAPNLENRPKDSDLEHRQPDDRRRAQFGRPSENGDANSFAWIAVIQFSLGIVAYFIVGAFVVFILYILGRVPHGIPKNDTIVAQSTMSFFMYLMLNRIFNMKRPPISLMFINLLLWTLASIFFTGIK